MSRQYLRDRRRAQSGIQHCGRKIEIRDSIVLFGERRNVFVANAEIQRQISANFPFILRIQIPIVAVKMVVVLSELHGCCLREPEQEVGKVVSGAGRLLRRLSGLSGNQSEVL